MSDVANLNDDLETDIFATLCKQSMNDLKILFNQYLFLPLFRDAEDLSYNATLKNLWFHFPTKETSADFYDMILKLYCVLVFAPNMKSFINDQYQSGSNNDDSTFTSDTTVSMVLSKFKNNMIFKTRVNKSISDLILTIDMCSAKV